ncbi:AT-rich interactive domain-containing 3B-like protein [Labeo rohita]|uniref:AT-rich interactive domain-containing 3B-like protein n=1 Tax=Labeo rohita TaxID=84645 RepID=A0A498M883_LABRO|nr:AT-rich interactive domain-containing 3B-like protein [Labeo rohita]
MKRSAPDRHALAGRTESGAGARARFTESYRVKRDERNGTKRSGGMVDNSGSSKTQMEAGLAGGFPHSASAGVKLEAMMEQLQRQQQARLEMEHKERRLREAHIMYAQQVAAQQAILAAARASGAGFVGKSLIVGPGQPPRVSNQSSLDSEREDEEERGRDSDEDDDDDGMMEGDEGSEEDDRPASGLEFLRKQTLALQQGAIRMAGRPFGSFSDPAAAADAQGAPSPAVRVKQEPEDDLSPVEQPSASSPNGQADWSYEDHFKVREETQRYTEARHIGFDVQKPVCDIGLTSHRRSLSWKTTQTAGFCHDSAADVMLYKPPLNRRTHEQIDYR